MEPGIVLDVVHPASARPGRTTHNRLPTDRQRSIGALARAGLQMFERAYVMGAVFLLSGALIPLLLRETVSSAELNDGHPLIRGLFLATYATMAVFVLSRWKSFMTMVLRDPGMLLLVGFAILSVFWSIDPGTTVRRGSALLLTTSFGWYLAARFGTLSLLRLLAASLTVILVASLIVSIVRPDLGVHASLHEGAWRGIFVQKNLLGRTAALAALLHAVLWRADPRLRLRSAGGFTLAVLLLIMSRSLTPLIALAAVLALLPFAGVVRWRFSRRAPVLAGGVFLAGVAALLVAMNFESAMLATGRDATLTGRTALWESIVETAGTRPALGAGYSAFWSTDNPEVAAVQDEAGWRAYGSHNGILDLVLELGALGLALFAVAVALAVRRSLRALRAGAGAASVWPVLVIAFVLLTSLAEGGLLRQNNLIWVVFVAAAATSVRTRPVHPQGVAGGHA